MNIQKLIDEYAAWIRSEITFEKLGEYYCITTPYLDNANDYLQIYVKQEGNDIFFTDDSVTIRNLKMAGFQFTKSRKEHMQRILHQYGVELNRDEIIAKVPINGFAQKKHMFVQALLKIDDMFTLSRQKVASLFLDDIQEFFDQNEIYPMENAQFIGISGFPHTYDFVMQRTKTKPERMCQAINSPNKSTMTNVLFAWSDTKPARKRQSQLIVILNDQNSIAKGVLEAYSNYDAKIILWSERAKKENLDLLSAS